MSTQIIVRDETTDGRAVGETVLEFLTETVTVRELIRSRVHQEVKDHNAGLRTHFRGLVQPTDTEADLNGFRLRMPRQIDWHKQFDTAVEAFERKGFLIITDDRQLTDLDEQITIRPGTEVTFLKLVPLVGG